MVRTAKSSKVTKKKPIERARPKVRVEPRQLKLSASDQIRTYYTDCLQKLSGKKADKEAIVNESNGFFEANLKTLFCAGFEISEIDPSLDNAPLDKLGYGRFYIRLTHKNFQKLQGDKYEPGLFLSFSEDHDKAMIAKFCLHFKARDFSVLLPANIKGTWLYKSETNKTWYNVCQEYISSFLEKIPALINFIEWTKSKQITKKESESVKREIVEMFMAPKRINDRRIIWKETQGATFYKKYIYSDESNLFEALINVVALFTARNRDNQKEYLEYTYAENSVYEEKNGKIANSDLSEGKLKVPINFDRRTYYIFSSVTKVAEEFSGAVKESKYGFSI